MQSMRSTRQCLLTGDRSLFRQLSLHSAIAPLIASLVRTHIVDFQHRDKFMSIRIFILLPAQSYAPATTMQRTGALLVQLKATGPPRQDAHGCSFHSARAENRSQVDHTPGSSRTRALRAVAENDPSHSTASEIQPILL